MRCKHCTRDVPDGVFCTHCGAHHGETSASGDPRRRLHSYAAHPGEPVFHPAIFTTLFPHLGRQKLDEFRWALLAGIAVIFGLYGFGLITAAILTSAFLVPALYLLYLYETQVYRDEPLLVLGLTIGAGIFLGILVTVIVDNLVDSTRAGDIQGLGTDAGVLLVLTVLVPVIQEIIKPLPALALRGRAPFTETVDGLVFGIAAGLGFALSETIVRFWSVLTSLPFQTDRSNWIFPLLTLAILLPLLQGSTTGLITASLWRAGKGLSGHREVGAIVLAVTAHVAFLFVSQVLVNDGVQQIVVLAYQTAIVGGLLVYIRYLLHHALLEEAGHMGFAATTCPNCHRHIVAEAFCPDCGKALAAAPASVRDRSTPAAAESAAPDGGQT
jgi:PrsW family intramembrane metalloprotease